MAKVHKVSFYVVDYNDEYEDKEHLKVYLEEYLKRLWVGINHIEIEESKSFEWEDELKINMTNATKDDFEEYFKINKEKMNI